MEIFAYIASALIGISLGLIGGGGSILTVPVLVYLFGLNPLLSTSYSLFIVGSTSVVGAFDNFRKGNINIKTAFLFGISSIITVFFIRKFLIPIIPKNLFSIGNYMVTESMLTMVLFAILMIISSFFMFRNGNGLTNAEANTKKINYLSLLLYGICIGIITGLLGAGGGFLLIPVLVLLVRLSMKEAIGTSLLIIALNSLIGFISDLGHFDINWLLLLKITLISIIGIFIGGWINKRVNATHLKKGFSLFVLLMAICIIIKELYLP
jgi:uncharacterized protein